MVKWKKEKNIFMKKYYEFFKNKYLNTYTKDKILKIIKGCHQDNLEIDLDFGLSRNLFDEIFEFVTYEIFCNHLKNCKKISYSHYYEKYNKILKTLSYEIYRFKEVCDNRLEQRINHYPSSSATDEEWLHLYKNCIEESVKFNIERTFERIIEKF